MITAILGGTGTGKSTLVNRLLDANLSAASFRRTFTAGPVAIVAATSSLPVGWLGVPHDPAAQADLPAAENRCADRRPRLPRAALQSLTRRYP